MKRTLQLAAPAMLLLAASFDASAQSMPNPGGLAQDTPRMETGNPPKNHANGQDKLFVRQATLGGRAEVALGELAGSKADSPAVREFGERMVTDHRKANEQLARIGRNANPSIPDGLNEPQARVRDTLGDLSGRDFDVAYMSGQVTDHQKTANLLLWEISYGQSAELTKYAADALPVVMDHLRHARDIKQELVAPTPASPPGAPPARNPEAD